MRVKTGSEPRGAALNPDEDTTFKLYALVAAPADVETMRQEYLAGAIGYKVAKERLLEALQGYFGPFRDKRAALETTRLTSRRSCVRAPNEAGGDSANAGYGARRRWPRRFEAGAAMSFFATSCRDPGLWRSWR